MDNETIKTISIIVVIAILTIWLFNTYSNAESFDNSFGVMDYAENIDRGQIVRTVQPNTSLQDTYDTPSNDSRVLESNNLDGVCAFKIGVQPDEVTRAGKPYPSMTRDEHHSLVSMRPHMKTYIETDAGIFTQNTKDEKSAVQSMEFEELSVVMDKFRDATLSTIYNGNEHNSKTQIPFY